MNGRFYAQIGEDVILAEIFAGQTNGTCIEIGALDGVKDSITLHFEERGWSCILVEANPELAEKAKLNRKARVFSCAAGAETGAVEFVIARGAEYLSTMTPTPSHLARIASDGGTIEKVQVPMRRIDDLLTEAKVTHLDFATVDVEGAELEVLRGFDLDRWKPKVLVIENNDRAVGSYLRNRGYHCFQRVGFNDWYCHKNDKSLLTAERLAAERRRKVRHGIYACTVGLLPIPIRMKIVNWKRKWLKDL